MKCMTAVQPRVPRGMARVPFKHVHAEITAHARSGSEGQTQHSQDTADAAQCTHRITPCATHPHTNNAHTNQDTPDSIWNRKHVRSSTVAQCWNCVQRIDCVTCHTHPLTHKLPGLAPLLLPRLGAPAVAITASNMKQPNKQAHARHSCVMTPHDATTLHYTHSLTHRRWRQLRLGGDISCEMRKCGSLRVNGERLGRRARTTKRSNFSRHGV
jgi:hypothetical protein